MYPTPGYRRPTHIWQPINGWDPQVCCEIGTRVVSGALWLDLETKLLVVIAPFWAKTSMASISSMKFSEKNWAPSWPSAMMLARSPLLRIRVRIPCVCEHHGDVGKEQDPVCDEIHYAPSAITTLPDMSRTSVLITFAKVTRQRTQSPSRPCASRCLEFWPRALSGDVWRSKSLLTRYLKDYGTTVVLSEVWVVSGFLWLLLVAKWLK